MTLEDLETHVPDQDAKIQKLIEWPGIFSNVGRDVLQKSEGLGDFSGFEAGHISWAKFWGSLWGIGLESLRAREFEVQDKEVKEEEGEEGEKTQKGVGVKKSGAATIRPVVKIPTTIIDSWELGGLYILVRSEYEEAEKAALSLNEDGGDALIVTGQPGIGKTHFLILLLMKRLALRLPTVWQVQESFVYLFHEGGTSKFLSDGVSNYMSLGSNDRSGRIWALVDSNQALQEPSPVLCFGEPFFVVQVAPRQQRRFEWANKIEAENFHMATWTLSEVLRARPFLGLSRGGPYEERELRYLFETYRATPRALSEYARQPAKYEVKVAAQVQSLNRDTLRYALEHPDFSTTSHLITRIEPSKSSRLLPEKTIASPGVLKLLWGWQLKDQVLDIKYYYHLFKGSPVMASAAGWIIELWMHRAFVKGYPLTLFPIRLSAESESGEFDTYDDYTDSEQGTNRVEFQLEASAEDHLGEGNQLEVNQYYGPLTTNFPTIGSLLLLHPPGGSPILFMFRITRDNAEHCVTVEDLLRIDGFRFHQNPRRCYVVVTPRDIHPRIKVPKGCFGNVDVFHHPVDGGELFSDT